MTTPQSPAVANGARPAGKGLGRRIRSELPPARPT